jgi:DNA-binding response OmpR family regulator
MNRQGRILIVENEERWRNLVGDTLRRGGFQVDTAGTLVEAQAALQSNWYHLAILDIRLDDDSDDSDIEGLKVLYDEIVASSIRDAMMIIVLSSFGTKEQMREAFTSAKVVDFLDKAKFNNLHFRSRVQQLFAEDAHLNLKLDIHWQQVETPEQVVVGLDVNNQRIKRDTPQQQRVAEELDDLLCRLFYKAESLLVQPLSSGQSGAVVLLAAPFYEAGPGQRVVVKFGDFRSIDAEYRNFEQYVQPFIGGGRSTSAVDIRRTPRLGGIVYSLLGSNNDALESFAGFYAHADIESIKDVLNRLFFETCGPWYANPSRLQLCDLTEEYQNLLGWTTEKLESALAQGLKSVHGKATLKFTDLDGERTFTNPIATANRQRFLRTTYRCTTHGDLNESNIMVDGSGHAWLIDFDCIGSGHILRDVAELDSVVRLQLLKENECKLEERLALEEALCAAVSFSHVGELETTFQTNNPTLAKAFATAVHLRTIGYRLVQHNPQADLSEYYIALFYYALNTLRFHSLLPSVQRQHALLTASLLADCLD